MESAVLNRVGILELYFVLNRGQGLRPSAVPLHPNMGQVPSPAPLNAVFGHRSRIYSITLLIVEAVCPFHVGGENESFGKRLRKLVPVFHDQYYPIRCGQ